MLIVNGDERPVTRPRSTLNAKTGHRSLMLRGLSGSTVFASTPVFAPAARTTASWPICHVTPRLSTELQTTLPHRAVSDSSVRTFGVDGVQVRLCSVPDRVGVWTLSQVIGVFVSP